MNIAILFGTLLICLFIGLPVAVSIGLSSATFLLMTGFPPISILTQRMVDSVFVYAHLALPLFVLAGEIMAYGCTPRIVRFAKMLLRRVPGGLGAVGVVGSAFFGAVSGSGTATITAIGGIVAPEMVRDGYDKGYTASLISASSCLGILIPPSIPMVIYAMSSGASVGRLFLAGILPGLVTMMIMVLYNTIISKKNGYYSKDDTEYTPGVRMKIVLDAILPLMMPVIVLGSALSGIVTPTESAIIAVVYSFILAFFVYKELKLKDIVTVCANTVTVSAVILLVVACASPFGWIIATENISTLLAEAIISVSSSPFVIMTLVLLLLIFLGTFMDVSAIIILLTPILLPIVTSIGFDPVHFGIILTINMAIGSCSPPLAVGLFTGCRIVGIQVEDSIPQILYFIAVLAICMTIVTLFPDLSLWLPNLVFQK